MNKPSVVIVEDDEVLLKVLLDELNDAGIDVSSALDGEEGLKKIQEKRPDLVLLDLLLPKKSGFEVLEDMKQATETRGIPVMILSMLGQDEDIKRGLGLGANDYIVKSQHAVGEVVEKVKNFFTKESHPPAK
ncbi:MAG TPA: response regulator [Candidatus Paceibacterota bacterium]|nr:response regulator [Candidatus Paceibacterota bacterium]